MPGTNTSNLSQTLVRFARKLLGSPSASDAIESMALGNCNDIDHLILLEDGINLNGLLKQAVSEIDLVSDAAAVHLDFHEVGLLLFERGLADLGVGEQTDDSAVFLDSLEFTRDGGTFVLRVVLGIFRKGLLLALVPVLVESSLDLVAQVLGPNGCEGSEASGSLNISNNTNSDHLEKRTKDRH